jgi:hypothetical protein
VRKLCEVESLPRAVVGLYHRYTRSNVIGNRLQIVPRSHQLGDNRVPAVVKWPAPNAEFFKHHAPIMLGPFLGHRLTALADKDML